MVKNIAMTVLANKSYLDNFEKIYHDLREIGKYSGDIVLLTDNRTNCNQIKKLKDEKVTIKRFQKIKFSRETNKHLNKIEFGRNKSKPFQWHKFYLFNEFFKKWNFIFYLDINMRINHEINELLDLAEENTLFAPYDAFPDLDWKLKSQFNTESLIYEKLQAKYDLDNPKYFQTGILFYDTDIIKNNTFDELLTLSETYPISKNNEQGIMNLYFMYDFPVFKKLPDRIKSKKTYSYWKLEEIESIITKKNIYRSTD